MVRNQDETRMISIMKEKWTARVLQRWWRRRPNHHTTIIMASLSHLKKMTKQAKGQGTIEYCCSDIILESVVVCDSYWVKDMRKNGQMLEQSDDICYSSLNFYCWGWTIGVLPLWYYLRVFLKFYYLRIIINTFLYNSNIRYNESLLSYSYRRRQLT